MSVALAACGFHFPKQQTLPFQSVYVVAPATSAFGADIRRQLVISKKVSVVERREDAQVLLEILGESAEKHILSLSAAGKVKEFELRYIINYRLTDQDKKDWIGPTSIFLRRNFTFDDRDLLAKEGEEGLLYREMKSDAVGMLMRQLARAAPPTPA